MANENDLPQEEHYSEQEIESRPSPMDELRALSEVVAALQRVGDNDVRQRVLQAAAAFFRVALAAGSSYHPPAPSNTGWHYPTIAQSVEQSGPRFSEDRSMSPKEFLMQKQPRTDVERVACLAYYLTHYTDMPHFKTIDISKLNTEAAQPKFSNPAQAVDNATNSHYLVPATKGNKQLSGAGELFVQALPDREAARAAMAAAKPRKRKKSSGQQNSTEDANSGDE